MTKLRWFRDIKILPSKRQKDTRPYFEASFIFQAGDMKEAERLFDNMTDALECNGECGEDIPCPFFRLGGLHQMDEE